MIITKKYFVATLAILLVKIVNVKSQKDVKSSLTFVIDDTGSMHDDIEQVKMSVNNIFDAVMKSNDSQIENFILVTFNDPDVIIRNVTKDRNEFKKALNAIFVQGGGDCPEFCMTGIEKALEISLPLSNLYVCTDASAKDFKRYKHVSALAQTKGSQVTFLLTGKCPGTTDDTPGYKEFYDLSASTNGQVFHLGKTDINDIIDYVIENVKGRRTPLARADFPPGEHKLNFTLDHKTTDVIIAASGEHPKVDVTDPDGIKSPLEKVVVKENVGIYSTNSSKPGVHTVKIESNSKSSVLVTGKTKFHFRYGFSTFTPTSVEDGATRPPADMKSYLSIQLIEGDDVDLKTVKFKDSDNHDITGEIPFTAFDEKNKFYLTELIDTPKELFKIFIIGYDSKTDSYLLRSTPTLIEPSTILEPPKSIAPKVNIDGEPKIKAEFYKSLILKCKIHAYPKPSVIWKEINTGVIINSTISIKELPYDYISIAEINKVNKNETYECSVTNEYGKVSKNVTVETINKFYLNVIEKPRDTIIEYGKSDTISCNVKAFPPVETFWFKNGQEISYLDDKTIEISNQNTTLTVKACNLNWLEITCVSIIAGVPKPSITWYFFNRFTKMQRIHKDAIEINNVDFKKSGIYKCVANNEKGIDFHVTQLIVEYAPTIKYNKKSMRVRVDEKITLNCNVDGVPQPTVRWFKNGVIITASRTKHIYKDHTLTFYATVDDSGKYTCTAENKYGSDNQTTTVYVYAPVSIKSPEESTLKVNVGSDINLQCFADGYPEPTLQWIFYNKETNAPKVMKSRDSSLTLPRVQLKDGGHYVCSASNVGGSANITYDVQVLAPPLIQNIYPDKTFKAVVGDLTLRIPCNAIGSPKPTITWMKNGLNIASGSEWFNIEDDGTLVIKNIDVVSAGAYVCEASNYFGSVQEVYEVVVDPYPRSGPATTTIVVENGKSTLLKCDVPHTFLDLLRWYKNGRLIYEGEYELKKVKLSDSGIYTCRVSNFTKSRTGNTMIKVGYKPQFQTYADEEIPFEVDTLTTFDCEAIAEPPPKVTWYYNGMLLDDMEMFKAIMMKLNNTGLYTCEVSNQFGTIRRDFKIKVTDCILDIAREFGVNQPLMHKSPLSWTNYDTSEGFIRVPKNEYISLYCPNNFQNFPKSYITAFCQGGTNFKVNGKSNYKFSDLKCNNEIKPVDRHTRKTCNYKGEEIKVGYEAFGNFLEAYSVCFDKSSNTPMYTKHILKHNLADVTPLENRWYHSDTVPLNFETLYSCDQQIDYISRNLGKWFHAHDKCCFSRRQLVNPKDMVPGLAQIATYSNVNIVPHWSSCSAKNWEAVEDRIRWLVKTIPYELTIYTGVWNNLELDGVHNITWSAHITDGRDGKQKVPEYLWKVIQDPVTQSSLAIIQVNVPDLKKRDAYKYELCTNICNEINWMRNPSWNDVTEGYTYCCQLRDFIRAFEFYYVFEDRYAKILYDVVTVAEHSLT